MGKKVSCHCRGPAREPLISSDGRPIGHYCRLCMRPLMLDCPVCRKPFRDVNAHLKTGPCSKHKRRTWGSNFYEEEIRDGKRDSGGNPRPAEATTPTQQDLFGPGPGALGDGQPDPTGHG